MYNTIEIFNQRLQNCLTDKKELPNHTEILEEMEKINLKPDDNTMLILKKISERVQKEKTKIKKKTAAITKRLTEERIKEFMKSKKLIQDS